MARKRQISISGIRSKTKLVVFLLIVAGLFMSVGWGSLSSFGYGVISYLCPLGALETLVASKLAIPRFIVVLLVMILLVVLLGRAFCAWICPIPSIEAFFHPKKKGHVAPQSADEANAADECPENADLASAEVPLPSGKKKALPAVGGKRDGLRIDSRHGVLAGALVSAAIFGYPVFCLVCPVGLSIATVVALWTLIFNQTPTWSLLVFPLLILAEVVFFRKWCHKICPLGALMSLLGAKSPLKPKVDSAVCLRSDGTDCNVCVSSCPEELDPHMKTLPECTKCGICQDKCPAHAITLFPLSAGCSEVSKTASSEEIHSSVSAEAKE